MKIGSLVRQKMFSQTVNRDTPKPVYRYGIVMDGWSPFPTSIIKNKYFKVLWQPSADYPVRSGSGYVDIIEASKLEVINEPLSKEEQNEQGGFSKNQNA